MIWLVERGLESGERCRSNETQKTYHHDSNEVGCVRGKLYLLLICQHKSIGAQILIKTKDLSELPVSVVYEIQSFVGLLCHGLKWVTRCDSVSYSHRHAASSECPATSLCLDKTWFLQTWSDYMPGFKKDQITRCNSCNVCQEDYWLFNERSSTMMLAFELCLFSCWLQKRAVQPFLRQ